jgi:starch-binding outer membrane protein, SusD/RagB family
MKNKITIILIAFLLTQSCDIDRSPLDNITAENLQQSETSILAATLGNYAMLKDWSQEWYRLAEYPGDNVSLSGTTSDALFFTYNYQRLVTSGRVANYWALSYRVIVGANKVMAVVQEGKSPDTDQLLGENYYLRALMHFSLVNVFGKPYTHGAENPGVPLKLDADHLSFPLRGSVGTVYDQVIADLLKAESLITMYKNNTLASPEAVWALLARVYLYMENNDKAIEYANKVINSINVSLLPTDRLAEYPTIVPEDNPETIFAIKHIKGKDYPSDGWFTIGSLYASILGTGWGEMYASKPYLDLVRTYPEDERNKFILPVVKDASKLVAYYQAEPTPGIYRYMKVNGVTKVGDDYQYPSGAGTATFEKEMNDLGAFDYYYTPAGGSRVKVTIENELEARNDYPKYYVLKTSGQEQIPHLWSPVISRLGEVYLIRAEAFAKKMDVPSAISDVNVIRERAGIRAEGLYDAGNLPAGKTALDIVLEERQLELAFEGHRKYDVFRNKRDMNRRYPGTHLTGTSPINYISWDANYIIEFIPESQRLLHEGLEQNP